MNVLQMKMSILRFDVRLLESDAFKAVIEQRGLLVSNHALSACQFPLLVQKSTQFPSDCRIRTGCIECKADDTCRIDSPGGRADSILEIRCRRGSFQSLSRGVLFCHFVSSTLGFEAAPSHGNLASP